MRRLVPPFTLAALLSGVALSACTKDSPTGVPADAVTLNAVADKFGKAEKTEKGDKSEKGGKPNAESGVLPLPTGFSPEGIAFGRGSTYYVGSISSGAIFRGDATGGTGSVFIAAQAGRQAVGLTVDSRNRLFVAGGSTGRAYVYDASTGATLATYQLSAPGSGLVNDVVVTKDAAFFTQSFRPEIYRVPIAPNGALPDASQVQTLPLTGDFVFVPGTFNANGIVATPSGKELIVVNSATGTLYVVDPETGVADAIALGGATVMGGDGLLLDGRTLYVVQGRANQVTVVTLSPGLRSGRVTRTITSTDFRFPSTVAEFGNALYVVNARFDVAPPPAPAPAVAFEVVRISKR